MLLYGRKHVYWISLDIHLEAAVLNLVKFLHFETNLNVVECLLFIKCLFCLGTRLFAKMLIEKLLPFLTTVLLALHVQGKLINCWSFTL